MNRVFADAYFYFALVNRRDRDHQRAVDFAKQYAGSYVTTACVLTEVGDGMSYHDTRLQFANLFDDLSRDANVTIVPCNEQLFSDGLQLYRQRSDKDWSLTDCISFVVMGQEGLTDALTGDHHFEQAGFRILMADP